MENHISPDDLREFMHMYENASTTARPAVSVSGGYAEVSIEVTNLFDE